MVERVERVTREEAPAEPVTASPREYHEITEVQPTGGTIARRVVWYVTSILLALLAFRFVLALLGANPGNGFANFIYTTSHPFVAPFFSLFNYNQHLGLGRFELYTLVAMAVYALIGYAIAQLVSLAQPRGTHHRHHATY